jgi:VIT1/CCC1 family predicted Fe2+/Mn2+ transporter
MALRVSNGIAILLMFLAGYGLGRGASNHPGRVGVAMVVLGLAMVGVAIALGG